MMTEDHSSGYCCNVSDTSDYCSTSNTYLCTDRAKTTSMKYYMCPNPSTKCYSTSPEEAFSGGSNTKILYTNDNTQQQAGTILGFGKNDLCGWRIVATTPYVTSKSIQLDIYSVIDATCSINTGNSITDAADEILCYNGSSYTFSAD
jgi:hypothetical protein